MNETEKHTRRELAHLACSTIHQDSPEDGAAYMECVGSLMKESQKPLKTYSYCMRCKLNFEGIIPHCLECGSKTQPYKTSSFGDGVTSYRHGARIFRPFNRTLVTYDGKTIAAVRKTKE